MICRPERSGCDAVGHNGRSAVNDRLLGCEQVCHCETYGQWPADRQAILGSPTITEKAANGDTERRTVFFTEVVLNNKLYNSTTHFRVYSLQFITLHYINLLPYSR